MTKIDDRLAEIMALATAATPGPWSWQSDRWHGGDVLRVGALEVNADVAAVPSDGEPNAAFIAASRTLVPELVAALWAVLALHKPAVGGEMGSINDGRCVACVDFHADMDCEQRAYPCPTARAIAAHLDVTQ